MFHIRFIFCIIQFAFAVMTFTYVIQNLALKGRRIKENYLLIIAALGSTIWSLSSCAHFFQTNMLSAHNCRAVSVLGAYMLMLATLFLIQKKSGIHTTWAKVINIIALVAALPTFLTSALPTVAVFRLEHHNPLSCEYKLTMPAMIAILYIGVIATFMLVLTIYTIKKAPAKRDRRFGIHFLFVLSAFVIGAIGDALPDSSFALSVSGSTFMQFFAVIFLIRSVESAEQYRINFPTMSQFIVTSLSTPVLLFDATKKLQIANEAAANFFGFALPAKKQTNFQIHTFFNLEDDHIFDFEGTQNSLGAIHKKKQLYCDLSVNKIIDPYGDLIGYIVTLTDQTERHQMIEDLQQARIEANEANHAKGVFLANMSHEIRTPMNSIIGFTDLILKEPISSSVRDYMSYIKTSSNNLLTLINSILDISKLESRKMELTCENYYVSVLIEDVFHTIDVLAKKKGLSFHMDIDPNFPHQLYGDVVRIRSILINILNNAVKYTPSGSIYFELLPSDEEADTFIFRITDTGIGIQKEAQKHLFDVFSQFDRRKNKNLEGTGLGLAISKGFAELMKGRIEVESVYGEGSTFTFIVPQVVIDPSPMRQIVPVATTADGALETDEISMEEYHVLAVDDNAINLKVIQGHLEKYGVTVDTADTGQEAFFLCKKNQYDIVLMDYMMPKMDDAEAMNLIRSISDHYATGGQGKIIVLTANAVEGAREDLLALGFDDYLSKPIASEELERILTTYCISGSSTEEVAGTSVTEPVVETVTENATESRPLAEQLPDIDVTQGMKQCGDNEDLYREVLYILMTDSPEQLTKLKQLYDNGEWENFTIHIHSLKGQLLNIGHKTLGEEAQKMEFASRDGDYTYVDEHIASFMEAYSQLLEQLRSIV